MPQNTMTTGERKERGQICEKCSFQPFQEEERDMRMRLEDHRRNNPVNDINAAL